MEGKCLSLSVLVFGLSYFPLDDHTIYYQNTYILDGAADHYMMRLI